MIGQGFSATALASSIISSTSDRWLLLRRLLTASGLRSRFIMPALGEAWMYKGTKREVRGHGPSCAAHP